MRRGVKYNMTEYSDIPYDSALQELINETHLDRWKIIVAYELGRRRGLLEKKRASN